MAAAKPVLRGLLQARMKKGFVGAVVLALVAPTSYKVGITMQREKAYKDFYRTYDPEQDYQRMVRCDVFQCIKPDGEICDEW